MMLAGVRGRHAFATAETSIAAQWQTLNSLEDISARIDSSRYGVICGADVSGMEFMCAVEVSSFAELPTGMGRMRVPEQLYAVFTHDPAAGVLSTTWGRVFDWLSESDYESAHKPDFERYGPGVDPLLPRDGVEIWLGVIGPA